MQSYTPSGRLSPLALVYALLASALLVGLAFVYQWLLKVIPFIYLNFLLTAGMALLISIAVGVVVEQGRVRSRVLALVIGVVVGLVALGASHWWSYHLLLGSADVGDLTERVTFSDFITLRANVGWKISHVHLGGVWTWIIWGIEAVILVGGGVVGGWVQSSEPYCEACDGWAKTMDPIAFAETPDAMVRAVAGARDMSALLTPAVLREAGASSRISYLPMTCNCEPRRGFLTVTHHRDTVDKKGKSKSVDTALHTAVTLGPEHVAALDTLRALPEAVAAS